MIDLLNARWPQRILALPWGIILLLLAVGAFGCVVLYSAAGGSMSPWALNHAVRLGAATIIMLLLALVPPRTWLTLAYPLYAGCLILLIAVEVSGAVRGGSQRWIDLGFMQLQPTEPMKLALVLALARFYQFLPAAYVGRVAGLWQPLALMAAPAFFALIQPDLGTAVALIVGGAAVMFLAGLSIWFFLVPGGLLAVAIPIIFQYLEPYQQRRVLVFLDPELDPLGAGYHITQSKIAIGSGGLAGKGFGQGTQSHLQYLPYAHTDFIFATMAEEWGFAGGMLLILAYGVMMLWGLGVARAAGQRFQQLAAGGLTMALFFLIFVNLMMVMGMAPVDGVPLPLMSYGGSAMLTVMMAFGILIGIHAETRSTVRQAVLGQT
jgi:rod shape determining protein RodA